MLEGGGGYNPNPRNYGESESATLGIHRFFFGGLPSLFLQQLVSYRYYESLIQNRIRR